MIFRRIHLFKRSLSSNALIPTLRSRGLLSQITSEKFCEDVEVEKTHVYLGADPTADSLHLGNLMPFMVLMHFYLRGHTVIPLIGGATGIVGDPSGRKTQRSETESQQRQRNVERLSKQMSTILANCLRMASKYESNISPGTIIPVNNYEWWKDMGMLQFLGTYGKHIRVSAMLGRESVRQRLDSEEGIGYNEFSYQILQAYDFWHLFSTMNCRCQIGGHDQWGNIVAGIDLIGRIKKNKNLKDPVGITVPLLTTPSGEKFGKSAGNAVFLSADRTKPYHLFQHLMRSPDEEVEQYLKLFTFISLDEIAQLMEKHREQPELRNAQRRLAFEVCELVHGTVNAKSAALLSSVMFGDTQADSSEILEAFRSQKISVPMARSKVVGNTWKNLISELNGISKSEVQRLIKSGAVYLGTKRNPLTSLKVEDSHVDMGMLLIRVGKTDYYVVDVIES